MSSKIIHAPWEYLQQATVPALQSFELSRLNHAANLKKEIDLLLEQWLDETAAAMLARFLMSQPLAQPSTSTRTVKSQLISAPVDGQIRALGRGRAK